MRIFALSAMKKVLYVVAVVVPIHTDAFGKNYLEDPRAFGLVAMGLVSGVYGISLLAQGIKKISSSPKPHQSILEDLALRTGGLLGAAGGLLLTASGGMVIACSKRIIKAVDQY
jgi:hypothetical protein